MSFHLGQGKIPFKTNKGTSGNVLTDEQNKPLPFRHFPPNGRLPERITLWPGGRQETETIPAPLYPVTPVLLHVFRQSPVSGTFPLKANSSQSFERSKEIF